jgi:putative NIF3 family GTP cyclohydrolase 1 type 2
MYRARHRTNALKAWTSQRPAQIAPDDSNVGFTPSCCALAQTITARQTIERIHQHLGVDLPPNTVDTFKAGDPDTQVKAVAVTMMATYDVLQRAAASGANLVITHEPTFYNHLDDPTELARRSDPVLRAKQEFITQHHMVIWRFHDGWHRHNPDGILLGMTKALGWTSYASQTDPRLFTLPATSLRQLAASAARKLSVQNVRVVGDPNLQVTSVAMQPGAAGPTRQIPLLERDDIEALIIGEVPEWETIEYVADAVSQGKKKALILLGHIPSEQAGMDECVAWLKQFVQEVPVTFVPAREPFWRP